VISAAAVSLLNVGISVFGSRQLRGLERFTCDEPLVQGKDYLCLTRNLVSGIRTRKDIILRTSRANPGKDVRELSDLADSKKNSKLLAVYDALDYYKIDALVSIGGDDTLKTANYLYRMQDLMPDIRRVRIVHLPKTID
jgi:6-phosphofructokinase 1